ncbi:MAG: Mrp/NBP35 family ATP-binding protein [Christensenella sp.]|uniref:Mrp/NBP35 family ATP-binding protein n=1 Tax=Christensenella sp. TaxID=1935934 RepID=UPI002B20CFB8|nr:Mrp/NBP35 family ATP-binding protein [Christensenella sp.]MEA5004090.1 Mrp/NBP35 family ATP-binding protein [Christensenella sp.]
MSENCTHDCGSCGESCASRQADPQDFIEQPHELSTVKKVIGVVSGKGGVGKSLVTAMMAVKLRRKGLVTAILDADITGPSIPKMFGVTEKATGAGETIFPVYTKEGIQIMSVNLLLPDETTPVVWRGPVIGATVKQFWTDTVWTDVDCLFVDMPPGTGDVPLTVFQSLPVDGIIVVASPQELVSMIVGKAVQMANMMDIPILGLVENMSYLACPDCGKEISVFGESHIEETAEKYGLSVLARIPLDPHIAQAADKGTIGEIEGEWLDSAADVVAVYQKGEEK